MSARLLPSNALFLHIPKTGGSWVEYSLPQIGVQIEQPATIEGVTFRHSLVPMLEDRYPFVFTFVRHPLSWYESWWKFQAGTWTVFEPGVWHPQRSLENCRSNDFSKFIRLCIQNGPGYVSRMYEWYIGPVGFEFAQFVGRHENLTDDLIRVLTLLEHSFDPEILRRFDPVNVSLKLCGEPVWDPDLRRQILALEAPAIRRFYPEWTDPSISARQDRHSANGLKTSQESFARRLFVKSGAKAGAFTTTR